MTETEFLRRRNLLGLPAPSSTLNKAIKYLQCLLLSTSLKHFRSLRCSLTKTKLRPSLIIAPQWRDRSLSSPDLPTPRSQSTPPVDPANCHFQTSSRTSDPLPPPPLSPQDQPSSQSPTHQNRNEDATHGPLPQSLLPHFVDPTYRANSRPSRLSPPSGFDQFTWGRLEDTSATGT